GVRGVTHDRHVPGHLLRGLGEPADVLVESQFCEGDVPRARSDPLDVRGGDGLRTEQEARDEPEVPVRATVQSAHGTLSGGHLSIDFGPDRQTHAGQGTRRVGAVLTGAPISAGYARI